MAYADIVVNDGASTPVARTFTVISTANGRVVRSDFSTPADALWTLTHAHSTNKRSGVTVKSHLVRFDIGVLDADGVTTHIANARVCMDVPVPIASDQLADHFASLIRNYLTNVVARALLKDSVG